LDCLFADIFFSAETRFFLLIERSKLPTMMLLALIAVSNISLSLALLVGNRRVVVIVPAAPPPLRWGEGGGGAASLSGIVPTAATKAARSASPSGDARRTAFAMAGLVTLDAGVRCLFAKYSIPFPPSLAGCGALFAVMVSLNAIAVAGDDDDDDHNEKKRMGEGLYRVLNPGATLLAKWLPVFFVPSLITLPLASGLGNAREVRIRAPRSVS